MSNAQEKGASETSRPSRPRRGRRGGKGRKQPETAVIQSAPPQPEATGKTTPENGEPRDTPKTSNKRRSSRSSSRRSGKTAPRPAAPNAGADTVSTSADALQASPNAPTSRPADPAPKNTSLPALRPEASLAVQASGERLPAVREPRSSEPERGGASRRPANVEGDALLEEGPFTFSEDTDDEPSPTPAKRRRSRRGGRGRKRTAQANAQSDMQSDIEPGIETDVRADEQQDTPLITPLQASQPERPESPAPEESARKTEEKAAAPVSAAPADLEKTPVAEDDDDDADFDASDFDDEDEEDGADDDVSGDGKRRSGKKGRSRAEATPKLPPRGHMKMLISVLPGDEVEVVLTEDGKVREYYVEMMHHAKIRGNVYKGVISNVDANLQAAFVNYGAVKNGFLQIDEVHPDYYQQPHEAGKGHKYPPIQKALKAGQEVIVQVVKEPNGSKGAFLTTWVSLAGRFLVLTPGQEDIGISRKVEDGEERSRLRELIKGLNPGKGLGAIVRTVSAGTSKTTLQKDLNYLKRLWKDITKRGASEKAPSLIYQEPGLASRAVRDYLADDIAEVWVDDAETAVAIRETATLLFPRKTDLVHLYESDRETLWEHFGIVKQLEQVHAREVFMPSGGRLVFDQTEALMAIDINSGRISGKTNFESMAYRTNMEAASTIAEQLRLRDIGGQIVIDFIEMRDPEHCREVEKSLRAAMRWDRARHDIGKMSSFGLLQIVRQRTGSSAISITLESCPYCRGTGQRRNLEWQAIQALRDLHRKIRLAVSGGQPRCVFEVETELGLYLLNHKRERLTRLERDFGIPVEVRISGLSDAATPGASTSGQQNNGNQQNGNGQQRNNGASSPGGNARGGNAGQNRQNEKNQGRDAEKGGRGASPRDAERRNQKPDAPKGGKNTAAPRDSAAPTYTADTADTLVAALPVVPDSKAASLTPVQGPAEADAAPEATLAAMPLAPLTQDAEQVSAVPQDTPDPAGEAEADNPEGPETDTDTPQADTPEAPESRPEPEQSPETVNMLDTPEIPAAEAPLVAGVEQIEVIEEAGQSVSAAPVEAAELIERVEVAEVVEVAVPAPKSAKPRSSAAKTRKPRSAAPKEDVNAETASPKKSRKKPAAKASEAGETEQNEQNGQAAKPAKTAKTAKTTKTPKAAKTAKADGSKPAPAAAEPETRPDTPEDTGSEA